MLQPLSYIHEAINCCSVHLLTVTLGENVFSMMIQINLNLCSTVLEMQDKLIKIQYLYNSYCIFKTNNFLGSSETWHGYAVIILNQCVALSLVEKSLKEKEY